MKKLLIILATLALTFGQKYYLREGPPFSTKAPNPEYRPHVNHPQGAHPAWGKLKGPYPTNGWFLNFVVKTGAQPINLHPFSVKLLNTGVEFCIPREKIANKISVRMSHVADWTMSFKDVSSYAIEKFDELSVTVNYGNE
jgi:hypothetical protein